MCHIHEYSFEGTATFHSDRTTVYTCTHYAGHALFVHALLVGCPIGDCTWLYVPWT